MSTLKYYLCDDGLPLATRGLLGACGGLAQIVNCVPDKNIKKSLLNFIITPQKRNANLIKTNLSEQTNLSEESQNDENKQVKGSTTLPPTNNELH